MKIKFPKEDARHTQLLNKANALIESGPSDGETIKEAYSLIEECAKNNSPRGNFCKALTLYFFDEDGDRKTEIIGALDRAIKLKYPFATDLKADYLANIGEEKELWSVLRSAKGGYACPLYEGRFLAGDYDFKPVSVNYKKAAQKFAEAAETCLEYDGVKNVYKDEFNDFSVRLGVNDFFRTQAGAANFHLMCVYGKWDFKENKQAYITAYRAVQNTGSPLNKYFAAGQYAEDCMRNVMGMHSLKTVNSLLNVVNERYKALDGGLQERWKEDYDGLWELYDEFYEYEQERLAAIGNIEVYGSPDFAKVNSISFSEVLHTVGEAVGRWADTPSSSPSRENYGTVTIDGREYTIDSDGYFRDSAGLRTGLRMNLSTKFVYDMNDNQIGHFDGFGYFYKD